MKNKSSKLGLVLVTLALYLALALGPLAPAVSASWGGGFVTPCYYDGGGSGT